MEGFVEQGLVKSIGVSNFSPEKIQSFMPGAKIRPSVNQVCRDCDQGLLALHSMPFCKRAYGRAATVFHS